MPERNSTLFKVDGFDVTIREDKQRAPRHIIWTFSGPIFLHHYMVRKYMRPLRCDELVHHKDENPLNNHIENLKIMTRAEHVIHHKPVLGYKFTAAQRKRLSDAHIGQTAWNKGLRGFKHSEQTKRNMSKAQKGRVITWGLAISKAKTKVTKEQLIEYISNNPKATIKDTKQHFNMKTHGFISRHGGLRKLRKEATR